MHFHNEFDQYRKLKDKMEAVVGNLLHITNRPTN